MVEPIFEDTPMPNPMRSSPTANKWAPTFEKLAKQKDPEKPIQIADGLDMRQAHNLAYQLRNHFPDFYVTARKIDEGIYGIWACGEEPS